MPEAAYTEKKKEKRRNTFFKKNKNEKIQKRKEEHEKKKGKEASKGCVFRPRRLKTLILSRNAQRNREAIEAQKKSDVEHPRKEKEEEKEKENEKMVDRWMTYFLEPMEMCHIKDCAARAETGSAEDTSGQTRQLHKAGRHQLTHQHSCRIPRTLCHCRTGRHAEGIATAREEVLPSLPPATLAQCATAGLLLLHAITAKGWHSPTGSRLQQVLSSLDVLVHGH